MGRRGDMFPVSYPEDTGPRFPPLSLDWTKQTEVPDMPDEEMVFTYVDLYGNEVAPDDPAAQTKFRPAELKRLRKGGFFPKAPGAPIEAAADESHPVLNSGIGAKGADSPDAAADGDAADALAEHGRRAKK